MVRGTSEAALKSSSDIKPENETRVFGHTGWRMIDRKWVYVHSGGGIGKDGPVDGGSTSN
jgi:hypothetical protein